MRRRRCGQQYVRYEEKYNKFLRATALIGELNAVGCYRIASRVCSRGVCTEFGLVIASRDTRFLLESDAYPPHESAGHILIGQEWSKIGDKAYAGDMRA